MKKLILTVMIIIAAAIAVPIRVKAADPVTGYTLPGFYGDVD